MNIVLSAIVLTAILTAAAFIGNAVGEAVNQWLETHFPDVQE